MDLEKVIKGLEICTTRPCYCTDCPYKANCALDSQELMEDALALLKWQDNEIDTLKTLLLGYETGAIKGNNDAINQEGR